MWEDDAASDIDHQYVLHLRSGISENSAFTSRSNGVHFIPTAFEFVDANMLRGDSRGYVFQHSSTLNTEIGRAHV